MRRFLIPVVIVMLAACSGGDQTPAPPVASSSPIQWDRSPDAIVFRADVEGGAETFSQRSAIPPCTVYGDNRVVWTNELGAFNTQVLWDKVTDEQIQNFVSVLTINQQFYTYSAKAELEPPTSPAPVVETLTLNVNNQPHRTDAFGGWDYAYYQDVVTACRQISSAPVLYEPEGGWVSAVEVPYDSSAPSVIWDAAAAGLSFAELAAGEPRWLTDRNLRFLWNMLLTSPPNLQFSEGELAYQVAVQVPGISRTAPPPP